MSRRAPRRAAEPDDEAEEPEDLDERDADDADDADGEEEDEDDAGYDDEEPLFEEEDVGR